MMLAIALCRSVVPMLAYWHHGRRFAEKLATTRSVIATLVGVPFSGNSEEGFGTACAVCFCDFTEGETVTRLPCGHQFHCGCIRPWLQRTQRCPLCSQTIDR